MNNRQRFAAVMRFQAPDRVPLPTLLQRFEGETIKRWQREGLPRDTQVGRHFGFDRVEVAPINVAPLPAFERAELEDAEEWRLGTDRALTARLEGKLDAIEEQYPIRQRKDWAAMQKLLNPASPARYPRFWSDYCRAARGRDYPLGICLPGPFSSLQDWLGVRSLAQAVREERAWVEEMVDYLGTFVTESLRRAVPEVDLDFAVVLENGAYRAPGVVGADFARLFVPWYVKVSGLLQGSGVGALLVETRGNVADLVPAWIEGGVTGICFLEVAAGLDALALRRQYGRRLVLIGNLDRLALAGGKRDVGGEVLCKVPALLEQGGYLPAPDAPIHSEVSLENYEYYLDLVRKLCAGRS